MAVAPLGRDDPQDLREHYLELFARIGRRRRRALGEADDELAGAAVLIRHARSAGASVDAIADALGVGKPAVYDLMRARGTDQHGRLAVLSVLGSRGGLQPDQLASELGLDVAATEGELRKLHGEGLVEPLMTEYGAGTSVTFWRLTRDGERALPRLINELGEPQQRRYELYFELSDTEHERLPGVAGNRLGATRLAVIEPYMTRITGTVRRPELAFTVFAHDAREAEAEGRRVFAELQAVADLSARQPVLAAIFDGTESR
jgi:DNA-binding MarR family transcriptional regulator